MKKVNLLTFKNLKSNTSLIKSIADNSDGALNRALVEFKNGLRLSVISGQHAYSGVGTFEIAPMKNDRSWIPEVFEEEDKGDDVIGFCNAEKVNFYINKIGSIKT